MRRPAARVLGVSPNKCVLYDKMRILPMSVQAPVPPKLTLQAAVMSLERAEEQAKY